MNTPIHRGAMIEGSRVASAHGTTLRKVLRRRGATLESWVLDLLPAVSSVAPRRNRSVTPRSRGVKPHGYLHLAATRPGSSGATGESCPAQTASRWSGSQQTVC